MSDAVIEKTKVMIIMGAVIEVEDIEQLNQSAMEQFRKALLSGDVELNGTVSVSVGENDYFNFSMEPVKIMPKSIDLIDQSGEPHKSIPAELNYSCGSLSIKIPDVLTATENSSNGTPIVLEQYEGRLMLTAYDRMREDPVIAYKWDKATESEKKAHDLA